MSLLTSLSASFALASSYVLSLYVWRSSRDRDHPDTVKRRFLSAAAMTLVSPTFVYFFGSKDILDRVGLASAVGLRWPGLGQAVAFPLFLTAVLFLGPIYAMVSSEAGLYYLFHPVYVRRGLEDLLVWRNLVVAPFTEEFTFRACMLPILVVSLDTSMTVLVAPLFFGVAHLHHAIERIRKGQGVAAAVAVSLFQMAYTTLFGAYSAFLFLRTGHLAAPVLSHALCNFMGFPDIGEIWRRPTPAARTALATAYVAGASVFAFLLFPLTEPSLYSNIIYNLV